jgi:hypothetical protein
LWLVGKQQKAVSAKSRFSLFFCFFDLRFDFGISNIATNRKRREIKFQTDPLPLLRTIPAPATDTVAVRVPPLLL